MRKYLKSLWKLIKTIFRRPVRSQPQNSSHKYPAKNIFPNRQEKSSHNVSSSDQVKSLNKKAAVKATLVEGIDTSQKALNYPSTPKRELLIDKPFEPQSESSGPSYSSSYPSMPERELLIDKPFEYRRERGSFSSSNSLGDKNKTNSHAPFVSSSETKPQDSDKASSRRPYIRYRIDKLEALANSEFAYPNRLSEIYHELQFRSSNRAKALSVRVLGRIKDLESTTAFAWPTTDVAPEKSPRDLPNRVFRHERGVLRLHGYRVGQNGLSKHERRKILDKVFLRPLSSINNSSLVREWGQPDSATRLKKIANSLAAFAKLAKGKTGKNFNQAIQDWEDDLAYLKRKYYDNRFSFRWPRTRISRNHRHR